MRTYRISESLDAFEYQWREPGPCIRKVLFWCKERAELVRQERISFNDKAAIKKFLDAGFVLRYREKM